MPKSRPLRGWIPPRSADRPSKWVSSEKSQRSAALLWCRTFVSESATAATKRVHKENYKPVMSQVQLSPSISCRHWSPLRYWPLYINLIYLTVLSMSVLKTLNRIATSLWSSSKIHPWSSTVSIVIILYTTPLSIAVISNIIHLENTVANVSNCCRPTSFLLIHLKLSLVYLNNSLNSILLPFI